MPQGASKQTNMPHTQDITYFQNSMKGSDNIKTIVLTAVVVLLLALDWAALHDILKGEPDLCLEYAIVMFSMIVFGVMIFITLKRKNKRANIA